MDSTTIKNKVQVSLNGKIKNITKGNGLMAKNMGKDNGNLQTETSIQANGFKEKSKVMAFIHLLMGKCMRVPLKTI